VRNDGGDGLAVDGQRQALVRPDGGDDRVCRRIKFMRSHGVNSPNSDRE